MFSRCSRKLHDKLPQNSNLYAFIHKRKKRTIKCILFCIHQLM